MKLYHKIQSIYKRDMNNKGRFILGQFSLPEFEYLKDNKWVWDEKIDGTNIRINYDGESVTFGGRTENAQIPSHLINKLKEKFTVDLFKEYFVDASKDSIVTLYGEGFGHKIQRGGKYLGSDVDFILFDALVGDWFLLRDSLEDIAIKFKLRIVPIVGSGTIDEAIEFAKNFKSTFGDFKAEGVVIRPEILLFSRSGHRIITKIKGCDFELK